MRPSSRKRKETASASVAPTLWLILFSSFVVTLAAFANDPSWWANQGKGAKPAVMPEQVVNTNGVITTNYVPNPAAAVTQGQLKQFTARAIDEMNAYLPGGAGTNLTGMASNWAQDYLTNGYNATNIKPSDYNAMTVGQLKYIGNAVWSQLVAGGYTNSMPSWLTSSNAADLDIANIGQIKSLFNFDLIIAAPTNFTVSEDPSGNFDLGWINNASNATSVILEVSTDNAFTWTPIATLSSSATSYTTSNLPSSQGYGYYFQVVAANNFGPGGSQQLSSPTVSAIPTLTVTYGGNQTSTVGSVAPRGIFVQLNDFLGYPIPNATVTFTVTSGEGQLAASPTGTPGASAFATTDAYGNAEVYLVQSATVGDTTTVKATFRGVSTSFTGTSLAAPPAGVPGPPSVTADASSTDGSLTLNWTDTTGNATSFLIERSDDGGASWSSVTTVSSGTATTYTAPASTYPTLAIYRVTSINSAGSSTPSLDPPPSYAVIDLGINKNALFINNADQCITSDFYDLNTNYYGYGREFYGNYYFWANAVSTAIPIPTTDVTPETIAWNISGLNDDGEVVGTVGLSGFSDFYGNETAPYDYFGTGKDLTTAGYDVNGNPIETDLYTQAFTWTPTGGYTTMDFGSWAYNETTLLSDYLAAQAPPPIGYGGGGFFVASNLGGPSDSSGGPLIDDSGLVYGNFSLGDYFNDTGAVFPFESANLAYVWGSSNANSVDVTGYYYHEATGSNPLTTSFEDVSQTPHTPVVINRAGSFEIDAVNSSYQVGSEVLPSSAVPSAVNDWYQPLIVGTGSSGGIPAGVAWLHSSGSWVSKHLIPYPNTVGVTLGNGVDVNPGYFPDPNAPIAMTVSSVTSIANNGEMLVGINSPLVQLPGSTYWGFAPEPLYGASGLWLNGQVYSLNVLTPATQGSHPQWGYISGSAMNGRGDIIGTASKLLYDAHGNPELDQNGNQMTEQHAILLLPVQISPYRPQMVPNSIDLTPTKTSQLIIPPSEVSSSGVHIRVNGDNENSNLLEVTFSSPALATMTGMTVTVQRSSSNLNVWTTSSKGAAIIGTGTNQGNLTLDSNGNATIWVEALAQGGNDLTFLLTSGSGTTTVGTLGKLHFVNYDSFVQAFSGETFGFFDPTKQGIFNVSQNLYLEGYNIAYYDVNTINSQANPPTGQRAFGELVNQIQSGFAQNVGVFGYSHGGGATYNTCNLLGGVTGTFSIKFAGYVDAIEYASETDDNTETLFPPGALFMWDYFELNGVNGNPPHLFGSDIPAAKVSVNVNLTPWGAPLVHADPGSIMSSPNVQAALQTSVETHVPKY